MIQPWGDLARLSGCWLQRAVSPDLAAIFSPAPSEYISEKRVVKHLGQPSGQDQQGWAALPGMR
jgi:hypothetical protein